MISPNFNPKMLPPLWAVLMIIFLRNFTSAKILMSALSLSTAYDFVIVGGACGVFCRVLYARAFLLMEPSGGTAGNVLANRLTEDPGIMVLVIESGGS